MRTITVLILSCAALFGQTNNKGQTVNLTAVPEQAITRLSFYTANQEIYRCEAVAVQPSFAWRRSSTTITNVVDAANVSTVTTSTAHGLTAGNKVVITGATVDADLNGTYVIQTVGATTTFTITTANVTDATYTDATLVITTTAPRTTEAIWAVRRWVYDATDNTQAQWATTSVGTTSGGVRMTAVCGDRATLAYN